MWTNWPVKFFNWSKIFLVPCKCWVALVYWEQVAWLELLVEAAFLSLLYFMSPDTMLEKQPSFLRIVISCFLVFTDKLHVITSARLFCGLWLLWNTVQTCILNFWPSWSTCGRRLEKLTKKSKSKKLQNVVQKDSVSMTVYFLWLSIKSIIIWHQIVFWTVYWEQSCQNACRGIMQASWQQGSRH